MVYGIPDVLGADRARYAGRRVAVVGSGHSAFNAILDLVALRDSEPATQIVWAIRGGAPGRKYGGGGDDQLPARGALGDAVRGLVEDGSIALLAGFQTREVSAGADAIVLRDGERELVADEIIAATGFRPNLALLGELRLDLDDRVEAARALAPLIDPNLHSCGSVPPHGVDELSHPDAGVYMVGMKSYGRAPTFLLRTGYEQVRSVAAALAGDWEAARQVELVLPETGVCSGPARCGERAARQGGVLRRGQQQRARRRRGAVSSDTHAIARPARAAWRSRAWGIVGALSVTETVSWGILYYAFAAFLIPMHDDLGYSTAQLTGAFSLALAVSALAGIAVGRHLDRHSPRALMTLGSIAGAALVVAWSQVDGLVAFYAAVGRDRAGDGDRALRARVHRRGQALHRARRAAPRDDRHDARGRARELHLPAALPSADRRLRLARRAADPRRRARGHHRPAARPRPATRAPRRAGAAPRSHRRRRGRRCARCRSGCSRWPSCWPR